MTLFLPTFFYQGWASNVHVVGSVSVGIVSGPRFCISSYCFGDLMIDQKRQSVIHATLHYSRVIFCRITYHIPNDSLFFGLSIFSGNYG